MKLTEKLAAIQLELKAPKKQYNKFGGYAYRNCEDILEAVKPLLNGLILTISDEMVLVGNRVYVKATATISDGSESLFVHAYAREPESRKGMDDSQVTGSASSYARKYALNGLFLIDDTKDADATNEPKQPPSSRTQEELVKLVSTAKTEDELKQMWAQMTADEKPMVKIIVKQLLEQLRGKE